MEGQRNGLWLISKRFFHDEAKSSHDLLLFPTDRHVRNDPSKLSAEQLRIRELERELEVVRMERDTLKSAAAFFAKESR